MANGYVKLLGRQGCPVGEVRVSIDGRCHKLLKENPQKYAFNVRSIRTGKIKSTTISNGKNTFSHILKDTSNFSDGEHIVLTVEKVLYDSRSDKKLKGKYMYRDGKKIHTGFV